MSNYSQAALKAQQDRNDQLIADSKYMRSSVTSQVLPLQIDMGGTDALDNKQIATLQALEIEARLREGGVLAKAVRPPTVPEGTSRIRFNVMATHSDEDVATVGVALGSD